MKTLTLSDIEVGKKYKPLKKENLCDACNRTDLESIVVTDIDGDNNLEYDIFNKEGEKVDWCWECYKPEHLTPYEPTTLLRDLSIRRDRDAEINMKVLKLLEEEGFLWVAGEKPTDFLWTKEYLGVATEEDDGSFGIENNQIAEDSRVSTGSIEIEARDFLAQYAPKTGKEEGVKVETAKDSFKVGDRVEIVNKSYFGSEKVIGHIEDLGEGLLGVRTEDNQYHAIEKDDLVKLPTVPEVKEPGFEYKGIPVEVRNTCPPGAMYLMNNSKITNSSPRGGKGEGMQVKVGDYVQYLEESFLSWGDMTKGKSYEVLNVRDDEVYICDDVGDEFWRPIEGFKLFTDSPIKNFFKTMLREVKGLMVSADPATRNLYQLRWIDVNNESEKIPTAEGIEAANRVTLNCVPFKTIEAYAASEVARLEKEEKKARK